MKTFMDIREGVYDPNIFKAFFIAGGPGSGKSFVVKRTTGGLGMKIVNSDPAFEKMLKDAGYSTDISDLDPTIRDTIRGKAKAVTKKRKDSFVDGRLGLIIDGTGKDYDKITRQATELKVRKIAFYALDMSRENLLYNPADWTSFIQDKPDPAEHYDDMSDAIIEQLNDGFKI